MRDIRLRRASAAIFFVALLLIFILPIGDSGRIAAAFLLIPAAIVIPLLIKKRSIHSINSGEVLVVVTLFALVLLMLYYLSGIKFGFIKNPYALSEANFLKYFFPIAAIIVTSEIIRSVYIAQRDKIVTFFSYLFCVVGEMLIVSNVSSVTSYNRFMDLVAGAMLPALLSNLLYNYLSKRYGIFPNISLRCITTLYAYTFPVVSGIGDSIVNFVKLLIPIAVYFFIDSLYEKKRSYALGNRSPMYRAVSTVLTTVVLIIMIGTVMLVSNQFKYGALVIATESMTGELNKGDVVIFESYDDQTITEGQVIVFERNGNMIVHRVVDIAIINDSTRYYTKGDANEDMDDGYITDADIRGVAEQKLPYCGYPTLWLRSLFQR